MSKRIVISIALIFGLTFLATAENTIQNPITPKNPNAGYTVSLKEISTIRADGEECFFSNIEDVQVAIDGSLFIMDSNQLLKFSPDGKFLHNFYDRGQGPGQAVSIPKFILDGNDLVISDIILARLMVFDSISYKLKKEFRIRQIGAFSLLFAGELYYFWHNELPSTGGQFKQIIIPNTIVAFTRKGDPVGKRLSVNIKYNHYNAGQNQVFSNPLQKILELPYDKQHLFLSVTSDYKILFYNIEKNIIVRSFSRKFKRVKVTEQTKQYAKTCLFDEICNDGKNWITIPRLEYFHDIQKISLYKDKLLVFTSASKNNNMVLVDIFNKYGDYIDNFYLICPNGNSPYNLSDWFKYIDKKGFVYLVKEDKEGNPYLSKCEMKNLE